MSLPTRRPTPLARCLVAGALATGLGAIAAVPATAAPVQSSFFATSVAAAVDGEADQTEEYITWVYRDLLNRDVDAEGLEGWSAALHAGTPRVAVANGITSSDEFRTNLVAASFMYFLDREPDEVGAQGWLDALRGGTTIQQLEAGILASEEFMSATSDDDSSWMEALYLAIFERDAAAEEIDVWVTAIEDGTSHAAVAHAILNSDEALTPRVDSFYQALLGRGIDETGAREWVAAVQAGVRLELIIGGIIASEEYFDLDRTPAAEPGDGNTGGGTGTDTGTDTGTGTTAP